MSETWDWDSTLLALSTPPVESLDEMYERFNDVLGVGRWTLRHEHSSFDVGMYTAFAYVSIHPTGEHGVTGYGESRRSRQAAYRNAIKSALRVLGVIAEEAQAQEAHSTQSTPVPSPIVDEAHALVQPDDDAELQVIASKLLDHERGKTKSCSHGPMHILVRRVMRGPKTGNPCAYWECAWKDSSHQKIWIPDDVMDWATANADPVTSR